MKNKHLASEILKKKEILENARKKLKENFVGIDFYPLSLSLRNFTFGLSKNNVYFLTAKHYYPLSPL